MRIWLLCALVAGASCTQSWNYDPASNWGPSAWPGVCTTSSTQSPIDIITTNTVPATLTPFSFSGYSSASVELENTGRTVKGYVSASAVLSGGGLPGSYKLAEFELHWDSISPQGSEHRLDGVQSLMEVQFVHYNTMYECLGEALGEPDGVVILAWWFEIGSFNTPWNDIIGPFPLLEPMTETITVPNLMAIMGPVTDYYRYDGSFTSPDHDCEEGVIWNVFTDKIGIDNSQLAVVQSAKDASLILIGPNYRPVQFPSGLTVHHHI